MRTILLLAPLALAGCLPAHEPRASDCEGGAVRVGGDARQGVVFEEGTGTRFDSRTRIAVGFGACA